MKLEQDNLGKLVIGPRGCVRPQKWPRVSAKAFYGDKASTSLGTDPNFAYHGGPVINYPRIRAGFWGALWADQAHQTRSSHLTQHLTDIVQSQFKNVL